MLAALLDPLAVALRNDRLVRELTALREAAEADRATLLARLGRQDIADTIVGAEEGLREVMRRVELVARADTPVLILGETGSGKEVVARAIHGRSPRASGPFLRVNCGAIPPELADSELFGHERGSFTGAAAQRRGWFERADGGTLFLDEVGELSPAIQVRLLRILQDGTFHLIAYPWPGNVRELATVIERAAILGNGRALDIPTALGTNASATTAPPPSSLPGIAARGRAPTSTERGSDGDQTLDETVRRHIEAALVDCLGRIEGPFGAARRLGINPHTLRARMRRLGIDWKRFRQPRP